MIESQLIYSSDGYIPLDIWTIAYMRALHTEPADAAARTADCAVKLWDQKRLQCARDCMNEAADD